ncbi:cytochrome c [Celeribacter sp.]|uniref:cytochrome c n=1 Tax=Celeribacter sp. TaxID=1890673 RepID=UPI003A9009DE
MIKRILTGGVALAALGIAGFAIYAWHPAIDPIETPTADSFDADQIEQGRILAAAGYCATCHTASDGAPYAGNYPMKTDFGTIYSTNITPDRDTGIGTWSEEAFERAMREGIDQNGAHLFPALPFDHFTKMSDEDIAALYAYIMSSVPPVAQEHRDNDLPFPLDQRVLQAGWKMLFFDEGRYEADPEKSDDWNRGAYLVEGVTHCGACHTPRNALGAEDMDEIYAGAAIDDWIAPPLTAANPSGVAWTTSAFFDYLKTGSSRYHGGASGPMAPVVHAGLRELPDSDLHAIAVYLGDMVGAPEEDPATNPAVIKSLAAGVPQQDYRADQGERLYATACASCHYNSEQIAAGRPDLGINSAMRLDDPTNLIHVMLEGVKADQGMEGVVMPAFSTLSDEQIAAIAAYLRASRTDKAPWDGLEQHVAEIRALGATAH